jgi:superfamily II DNA or RNA helicase
MTQLRTYQEKVIEDFNREVAAGKRRIILVAPTGSGKTVVASAIIKAATESRRGVLVLAHRRESSTKPARNCRRTAFRTASSRQVFQSARSNPCRWPASKRCTRELSDPIGWNCRPPIC